MWTHKLNVLFLDNLKNLTEGVLNLKCVPVAIIIVCDLKFLTVNVKRVLHISYCLVSH